MGFRFQRRVGLGNGLGLNVSGSGISLSQRTRWGSIGTRGGSIRTGIPGLSYRFGKRSGGGIIALFVGIVSLGIFGIAALLRFAVLAVYWLLVGTVQITRWVTLTLYDLAVYIVARRLPDADPRLDRPKGP